MMRNRKYILVVLLLAFSLNAAAQNHDSIMRSYGIDPDHMPIGMAVPGELTRPHTALVFNNLKCKISFYTSADGKKWAADYISAYGSKYILLPPENDKAYLTLQNKGRKPEVYNLATETYYFTIDENTKRIVLRKKSEE